MAGVPLITVGHVGVRGPDLARLAAFYRDALGLKQIVDEPDVIGIFELGDADFFVMPGEPTHIGFDLATSDIQGLHAHLVGLGVQCSDVQSDERSGHAAFTFTDPAGNVLSVCSAHSRNLPT